MGLDADPEGDIDEDDDNVAEDLSEAGPVGEGVDLPIGPFLLLYHCDHNNNNNNNLPVIGV